MQIFKASGVGNIAGCIVEEGRITRDSVVRITRGSEKVYEGPIASLKHSRMRLRKSRQVLSVVWYLKSSMISSQRI